MALEQRIVAIDCETTGFSRHDRIIEFAAVEVDIDTGQVVDEIDTLVNPERDVGPVDVHGVTASMNKALDPERSGARAAQQARTTWCGSCRVPTTPSRTRRC